VLNKPAQYVSTKLNIVLKNIPMLAGSAIRQVSCEMGSVVSDGACFMKAGGSLGWGGVFEIRNERLTKTF
jgi:hypothetical protein